MPPIPPGLSALNNTLQPFTYVFLFDLDLIAAAAQHSAALAQPTPQREERALKAFIAGLDTSTKDALLLRVARQEPGAGAEIISLFHSQQAVTAQPPTTTPTLAAITQESERVRIANAKAKAARQRKEAEAQAKAEAKILAKRHQHLSNHWEISWDEVTSDINLRQHNSYQRAVNLLVELQDATTTDTQKIDFTTRLSDIRITHKRLTSFMRMINATNLPKS